MPVAFGPGNLMAGVLEGRLRRTANMITFNVQREVIRAAAAQAQTGLGAGTAAMTAAVGRGVMDERKRELANSTISSDVRRAILSGYERKVTPGAFRNPQYDNRTNRLSGKLRPALEDAANYTSGPKQIQILNTANLTREAQHWARLNFGVKGPAVSGRSPDVRFNLFGREYSIGFNEEPRPGYRLPHGSFTDPGGAQRGYNPSRRGLDAFQPHASSLRDRIPVPESPIRGIEPRYFLEDGLREFPRSFRRQYNRLVSDAIDGVDGSAVQREVRSAIQQSQSGTVNFGHLKISVTD